MKTNLIVIDKIEDMVELKSRAMALGFFDGIHVGHRRIIERTRDYALSRNLTSTVLSFIDFPTKESKTIFSLEERVAILSEIGIDEFIVIRFLDEFKNMEPEDFYNEFLVKKFNAKALFTGEDYSFGKGGKGSIELLRELIKKDEIFHEAIPDIKLNDVRISSTWIRQAITEGDMGIVHELLGGLYYSVRGVVKQGKKLGRTLGFPTINQEFPSDKYVCRKGVYKSLTIIDKKEYPSISNVGLRPTVENSNNINCETYIYNFNSDIYGKDVQVRLIEFIRDEMAFSSVDELKAQVDNDKLKVEKMWKLV